MWIPGGWKVYTVLLYVDNIRIGYNTPKEISHVFVIINVTHYEKTVHLKKKKKCIKSLSFRVALELQFMGKKQHFIKL